MTPETFTCGEAYTAMCLWEAILDGLNEPNAPWQHCRERQGMATLRDLVMGLAKACEADWNALSEDEQDGQGPFDWEFCPKWLREAVDWWSLGSNGPLIRPKVKEALK